jgi:predicted nuclease of predicted toxin-antitoxin system
MKLLFDHNLSFRLVARLADLFPDSSHVLTAGLDQVPDEDVWLYAYEHDCIIVTKDADFNDLSVFRGSPPKVIWLRIGNCTTKEIEHLLRSNYDIINKFAMDTSVNLLSLG